MLKHRGQLFLLTTAVLLFAGLGALWWAYSPLTPPADTTLTVRPGASLIQVSHQLADHGVIRSPLALQLLARVKHQQASIHAGTYSFSQAASPSQVLKRLVSGDVQLSQVTIPEGFNLQQVAERLAARGLADQTRLLRISKDPEYLARLGIDGNSVEGYLFPETYRFVPGLPEEELLKMMVSEFKRQYQHLTKQLKQPPTLSRHQLTTLASIIQKETGLDAEMPLISSVFHNRLRRGIPLQTDPTVIYGIKDFNGNLTRKDLKTPSPYNTYLNTGLPPGPIANPGYKALAAAAQPAQSKYLYFVAKGDGSHQFSKTLREHNRAVRKYQLHRRY